MSAGPDAAPRLERALVHAARAAGIAIEIRAADWQRWASVTFTGARHQLTLVAAASGSLDAWLASLPEHEFRLGGHLVADLVVNRIERVGAVVEIAIEALTVEDC